MRGDSGSGDRPAPIVPLGLGWTIGVIAGFAEYVSLTIRHALGEPTWMGAPTAWLAPLTGGLLGAVLTLAGRIPRSTSAARCRLGLALPVMVASWSLLLTAVPELAWWASGLLAMGLALQVWRLAPAFFQGSRVSWLRVGLAAAGIPLLAWVAVGPLGEWREGVRIAALPPPPPGAPNVILLVLDTERATSLSLYGRDRPTTPVLDSLAARGVTFDRAMATSSWTLPSHASMFTGREAHELSAAWLTPLDDSYPVLAEWFTAAGYVTGGFVANLYYANRQFGLARGFIHYEDFTATLAESAVSLGWLRALLHASVVRNRLPSKQVFTRPEAAGINERALRWLDRRGSRPFLVFLNYMEPHEPYLPSAPSMRRFGIEEPVDYSPAQYRLRDLHFPWRPLSKLGPGLIARRLDSYEATIAEADAALGLLLGELGDRDLLSNTLIVVTSDHGEHFNEHRSRFTHLRAFVHGQTLYSQELWVPLVMVLPARIPAGKRIDTPVSLRHLAMTLSDLAGVPPPADVPGTSLATLWRTTNPPEAFPPAIATLVPGHPNRTPDWWVAAITDGDHHFIRYGTGPVELFNHRSDPDNLHDLAHGGSGEDSTRIRMLDGLLRQRLSAWGPAIR